METPSHTCPAGGVVHSHRLQNVDHDHRQVICTVCGDLGWVNDREAAAEAACRHMVDGGSAGRLTAQDLAELARMAEAAALDAPGRDEHDRLYQLAARVRGHAAPVVDVDERARIREHLIVDARLACLKWEGAKRIAGEPFAGPEAAMAYREAWGHWCGLHRAIEIIDRIDQQET